MVVINASIILYNNSYEQIKKVINSFLTTSLSVNLYLIDNSQKDDLRELVNLDSRIIYIFNNKNLGYGSAHNIAMNESIVSGIKYHLVLNPDLVFEENVIPELFNYMEKNLDVGNIIPKVVYPNGDFQKLCKLLPTPLDWFGRFISNYINIEYLNKQNDLFEMKFADFNSVIEVPYMSGCFMFLRTETLKKSGLFDEKIFLHTEDTDLSRRMFKISKNIYYPYVSIIHEHNREAYRNIKVMKMQIKSMIYYFNKWGWFFDKDRKRINKSVIQKYIKSFSAS